MLGGDPSYNKFTKQLVFGPEPNLERVLGMQMMGMSGALNTGFLFVSDWLPKSKVYLPEPVVGIHERIGLRAYVSKMHSYPYYDRETKSLNISRTAEFLRKLDKQSVIVLHASGHNPSGLTPTQGEWDVLLDICKEKELLPFFLFPYQGLVSGNLHEDAYVIRKFFREGLQFMVGHSYSNNMGIYGERAGSFQLACLDATTAQNVMSHLTIQIRRFYSIPPLHPMRIVNAVFSNPAYYSQWTEELKGVHSRMVSMRKGLKNLLVDMKTPGNWNHLTKQVGPHCDLGLTSILLIWGYKNR